MSGKKRVKSAFHYGKCSKTNSKTALLVLIILAIFEYKQQVCTPS